MVKKKNSQNEVKDKGKTEGSQSRHGLSLKVKAGSVFDGRGGMGRHVAGLRSNKAAAASQSMTRKERTKGNPKYFRNDDFKFLSIS